MKFVDLARYKFLLEPRYHFYGWSNSPRMLARESAARALAQARASLPRGYNLKIWDAKRTRRVQILMLASFRRRLRLAHPTWSRKKLDGALYTFGGRPLKRVARLDTHRNGGAFDLTIVDQRGNELYMGADHDDLTSRAALDYFVRKFHLTPLEREAKKNRLLLKRAMASVGFKSYAPEWWHWSYNR